MEEGNAALKQGGQPGNQNGNWRGGPQEGICQQCGSAFSAPRWEMKHRRFCSRKCSDLAKIDPATRKTRPHVIVAERVFGKRLPLSAVVHHVNENRKDNSCSNLVICQDQAYHLLLHVRKRIYDAGGNPNTDKICSRCKTPKPLTEFHLAPTNGDGRRCYCKPCQSEIYHERRSI
jgi:hypothetical protein